MARHPEPDARPSDLEIRPIFEAAISHSMTPRLRDSQLTGSGSPKVSARLTRRARAIHTGLDSSHNGIHVRHDGRSPTSPSRKFYTLVRAIVGSGVEDSKAASYPRTTAIHGHPRSTAAGDRRTSDGLVHDDRTCQFDAAQAGVEAALDR